jgi:ATP-binding cassette subfamily B protein
MKIWPLIYNILKKNRLFVVFTVSLLTFSSFIEASSIISITPIIDMLIHPDLSKASGITLKVVEFFNYIKLPVTFVAITTFFIVVIIFKNAVRSLSKFVFSKLYFRLIREVIFDEFRTFLSSSWQFFTSKKYGVLGNTVVKETGSAGLAFEASSEILSNALNILFYLCIAFMISWKLTAIVLVLVGVSLIPFSLLGRITYKIGKYHTNAGNEFQGLIMETFNAAKLIFGFGNQEKSISILANIMPVYIRSAIQFIMIRVITPLAFEPIGMVILISAVYLGLYRFNLGLSEVFVMLYAFRMGSSYALNITNQKNIIQNAGPSLEQIYNLKNEAELMVQPSGSEKFLGLRKEIRMKDVSFSYPTYENVLNNISLVIPKGKMIAIVGKSGSGKTTLIDIIMGFYQAQSGRYLLDELPFERVDVKSWRKRIGYVPQDAFLFNMSLKDNLLWSNENATDEEIRNACEIANADEFIERLPERLDTIVGERGVRLSGGQRQRIALARAILRKPEVLILDEATSSLDSHSELLIQGAIEKIAKSTTMIVIAHRLSTIKKSDYVYVLDEGYIVEEGSVETLIAMKDGEFLKTAKLQGMLITESGISGL